MECRNGNEPTIRVARKIPLASCRRLVQRIEITTRRRFRQPQLLQVADYCAWALHRKWEREPPDTRSYTQIRNKIATEYDLLGNGSRL